MSDEPRLHQSTASILIAKSPLHAWYQYTHGAEPSAAMERGSLVDRLLLGDPHGDIVSVDPEDYPSQPKKKGEPGLPPKGWTNDAIRARRDEIRAMRGIPVLKDDLAEYERTAEMFREKIAARGIDLSRGQTHVKLKWTSPEGVECGGELDWLFVGENHAEINDVKTCADASDKAINGAIVAHGNDIQHAAYIEAVECLYPNLAGRVRFNFIFCEDDGPCDVRIVRLSGTMRALGSFKWSKAKRIWAECLKAGVWPGYADLEADAKPYQLTEMMEEGEVMTFGGD